MVKNVLKERVRKMIGKKMNDTILIEEFPTSSIHPHVVKGAGIMPIACFPSTSKRSQEWCVLFGHEIAKSNLAEIPVYEDLGGGLDNTTDPIIKGVCKEAREESGNMFWFHPSRLQIPYFIPIDVETNIPGTWYRSYLCEVPFRIGSGFPSHAKKNFEHLYTQKVPHCWLEMNDWKWIPISQFMNSPLKTKKIMGLHTTETAYQYKDIHGDTIWITQRPYKIWTQPNVEVIQKDGQIHSYASKSSLAEWVTEPTKKQWSPLDLKRAKMSRRSLSQHQHAVWDPCVIYQMKGEFPEIPRFQS